MTAFGVVTNDHLDLLVSGAVEYLILTNMTAAAFTDTTGGTGIVATPTEAGALLRDEHVAALRWRGSRGRDVLELPVDLVQYVHRPVDTLDPVEVLKARHTYEHVLADQPGLSQASSRAASPMRSPEPLPDDSRVTTRPPSCGAACTAARSA